MLLARLYTCIVVCIAPLQLQVRACPHQHIVVVPSLPSGLLAFVPQADIGVHLKTFLGHLMRRWIRELAEMAMMHYH